MKANLVHFILNKLERAIPVMLLQVVYSEGSSPGRQGFQMAVSMDKKMTGSIGGGIMEEKLVEWSISLLKNGSDNVALKHQYHDKEHAKEQSGMICSGFQVVAFLPFYKKDVALFQEIKNAIEQRDNRILSFSPKGLSFHSDEKTPLDYQYTDENNWTYLCRINEQPVLHIIGAGHVSLALSELMHYLGFYIKVYDDRQDLNTMAENTFCQEKHIVDYKKLNQEIEVYPGDFIVIMTFGYRSDKIVLKELIHQKSAYIGMMGSQAKVETLITELKTDGINSFQLDTVDMPIGIRLNSKTPKEIAVSIAAEIIRHKNQLL